MGRKEADIIESGSGCGKTSGGLYIVCPGLCHKSAHRNLFFPGQKTGLNDYLKNLTGAGLLNCFYLMENLSLVTVLQIPDIDNHIDLVGALLYGSPGLKYLYRLRIIAVRKPDYRTDTHPVPNIFLGPFYKGGGNAYGRGVVLHCVVAKLFYLCPCRFRMQQSMVYRCKYFFFIHIIISLFLRSVPENFFPSNMHHTWRIIWSK